MMDRRNFLGWAAAAFAAAGSAVWVRSYNRAAGPVTNTCVQNFTGMRVHRLSDSQQYIVGVEPLQYTVGWAVDVILRNDAGLEVAYTTTNVEHFEELQLAAVDGTTFTIEVTQEVLRGEA